MNKYIQLNRRSIFLALGISVGFFTPLITLLITGDLPSDKAFKLIEILALDIMVLGFLHKGLMENKVICALFVLGFLSIHIPIFLWFTKGVLPQTNLYYYLGLFIMVFCLYIAKSPPKKQI